MNTTLSKAIQYHQEGDLQNAEKNYIRLLEVNPSDPKVLCNLGSVFDTQGRLDEAADCYRRAISVVDFAEANYNLGNTLVRLGQNDEAVYFYKQALKKKASYSGAANNLSVALCNIAEKYISQGNLDEAEKKYKEALQIFPGNVSICVNLGNLYTKLNDLNEAVAYYQRSLDIKETLEAYNNLGKIFNKLEKHEEAIASYRKALEIDSNNTEVYYNLGVVLYEQGMLDESKNAFNKAIACDHEFVEAYNSLAIVQYDLHTIDEAVETLEKALQIKPDYAEAHSTLSYILRGRSHENEARKEYEWRFSSENQLPGKRDFMQPMWDGSDPANQSFFVWGEQGVGDEIMFASMIPYFESANASVVLESDPRLIPLFARSFPGVKCIPKSDPPYRDTDWHIPSGSLWHYLKRTMDIAELTKQRSYLKADPEITEQCRHRYKQDNKTIIGISWTTIGVAVLEYPSSLVIWKNILQMDDVCFVSLQYGEYEAELETVKRELGIDIYQDKNIDSLNDLDGVAAQIAAVDIVITIPNINMHMANALDKPLKLFELRKKTTSEAEEEIKAAAKDIAGMIKKH